MKLSTIVQTCSNLGQLAVTLITLMVINSILMIPAAGIIREVMRLGN